MITAYDSSRGEMVTTLRGEAISLLKIEGTIPFRRIQDHTGATMERLDNVLDCLVRDGVIEKTEMGYRLC